MTGSKPTTRNLIIGAAGALVAATATAMPAKSQDFAERPTRIEHTEPMHLLEMDPVYDIRHKSASAGEHAMNGDRDETDGNAGARHDDWRAKQGQTLRSVLERWAEAAGWSVAWESNHTYFLQASARFGGSFVEATEDLTSSFEKADPPVFAHFYNGNNVVVIKTPATAPTR